MLKKELEEAYKNLQEKYDNLEQSYNNLDSFYAEMEEKVCVAENKVDMLKSGVQPMQELVDWLINRGYPNIDNLKDYMNEFLKFEKKEVDNCIW